MVAFTLLLPLRLPRLPRRAASKRIRTLEWALVFTQGAIARFKLIGSCVAGSARATRRIGSSKPSRRHAITWPSSLYPARRPDERVTGGAPPLITGAPWHHL